MINWIHWNVICPIAQVLSTFLHWYDINVGNRLFDLLCDFIVRFGVNLSDFGYDLFALPMNIAVYHNDQMYAMITFFGRFKVFYTPHSWYGFHSYTEEMRRQQKEYKANLSYDDDMPF